MFILFQVMEKVFFIVLVLVNDYNPAAKWPFLFHNSYNIIIIYYTYTCAIPSTSLVRAGMYKESLNSFIIHTSFFTATYALLSSSVAPPVQCLQLVSVIMSGLKTCSQAEAWCGWQASSASANDWDARKACPDPDQTCTHTNLCTTNNIPAVYINSGTCTQTHTLAQQVRESLRV